MKKLLNWLKSPSSDFVLFVIFLVLLNFASHNSYKRFDLTAPSSYSLSKDSKSLVKNIEQPLTVRVFFDDNLPAQYSSVAQYIKDILVEYKASANKNFSVIYMDMSKDESQELAMDYGLRQLQIQEVKNNEVGLKKAYMGLVVTYGDNVETIDGITTGDGFEYKLTSKISKMIDTADTLAGMATNQKIQLTLYLSDILKSLRINGADVTENVIKQAYENLNKKNFNKLELKVVSPKETETQELIDNYGLQALYYQADGNGSRQTAVLGLVIEYGDNFRIIPLKVQQSFFGYTIAGLENIEESISQGLESLLSKATFLGYVKGHNEMTYDGEQDAKAFVNLVSNLYNVVDIDLNSEDIPASMASIIINGPQNDFTEEELYKIDQFIMRGGNVMFFIDSMVADSSYMYYQQGTPDYKPNNNNLDRLLQAYGLNRDFNIVMDKNCYVNQDMQYGKLDLFWVPVVKKQQMDKKNVITSNLPAIVMLQNGSIDVSKAKENKNIKTTVLVKSSDESWVATENVKLNPIMIEPPVEKSEFAPKNLAVLLEGKFESAFDKAPQTQEQSQDDLVATNHISTSILPGKVFVSNSAQITSYQIVDDSGENTNAMFLMNVVDYMNGNQELCAMRTKGLSLSLLTVKNKGAANFWKYFNQFGLTALVVLCGFFVWRARTRHRKQINAKYNPNDTRTIK